MQAKHPLRLAVTAAVAVGALATGSVAAAKPAPRDPQKSTPARAAKPASAVAQSDERRYGFQLYVAEIDGRHTGIAFG